MVSIIPRVLRAKHRTALSIIPRVFSAEHYSAFSIIPRVLSAEHHTAVSVIPRVLSALHHSAFSVTHSSGCLLHYLEEEACPRDKRRGKVGETFLFAYSRLSSQREMKANHKGRKITVSSSLGSWRKRKN